MEQKYYFITVFNSYDEFGPHNLRCWAFYNNWDDANYTLSNNTYSEFSATPSNYLTNLNNLYLDKDDADTYFGMKCHEYESTSGHSCLEIGLLLRVSQVNQ